MKRTDVIRSGDQVVFKADGLYRLEWHDLALRAIGRGLVRLGIAIAGGDIGLDSPAYRFGRPLRQAMS